MKVAQINNTLNLISVKNPKKVSDEEVKKISEKELEEAKAVSSAQEKAMKAEGIEKDVMIANIEAASINPQLINTLKFHTFHSEKDYEKTSKIVGKKINIYDTHHC